MNTNLKSYLIIIAILFVLFLIVILFPIKRSKPSIILPTPIQQTLPTKILLPAKAIAPTLIPVKPQTGVREEELPKPVKDLALQKQELRKKTPLQLSGFIISFDYAADKFAVTLQEPKSDTSLSFRTWLKANYPAIPVDRFVIR